MCLQGKKIIITGGSSGIGRATAIQCADVGAQVVIVGRNKSELEKTLTMMSGNEHIAIEYDLRDVENIKSIFDMVIQKVGKLDGLVYAAGIPGVVPIRALDYIQQEEVMKVNYFAFVEMVKYYSMKKYNNGGSIVGVSSVVTERGEQCQTAYAASKGAMEAAIKCLAIELVKKEIRVNAVLPGMIRTEMMRKVIEAGSREEELGKTSLLGVGNPEQVADSIVYLLSDKASHTTGRNMYVDGGCLL